MNNLFISILKETINDFITYKRNCGYKYKSEVDVLKQFDRYYNSLNINEIIMSREIIEEFLTLKENERISNQINKATIIRNFIDFLRKNNYVKNPYIIPSISLKGEKEYVPYIFSKLELRGIADYFNNYEKYCKNKQEISNCYINTLNSVKTIINILMYTGMRISEVVNLKENEVDLQNNTFIINIAKNDNKRIVPFSNNLSAIIKEYINNIPKNVCNDTKLMFFSIDKNNEFNVINSRVVYFYFRKALNHLGIKHIKGKGPRLHDFRHTYCVLALKQLHQNEENINLAISYLSTYLGHKSFSETEKYIWLTPDLFNDTKLKMEQYSKFIEEKTGELFND